MTNYGTIEEKAAEWNISVRHIQYLCRTKKIEGAIKRAGAWFIPDGTPIPAKNSKSSAEDFKFVGTKSSIFNSAIELFLTKGFGEVSFKDIAERAGIRQSTIYNHFKTKQEILDTIYDYYRHYFVKERLSLAEMKRVSENESLTEIIRCIRYDFKDDYRQKMSDITKIILQRIGIDEQAREIAGSLIVTEGVKYVEDVFDNAVESGSVAPFDTHTLAVMINTIRIFTFFYWIIDPSPESIAKLHKDEQAMYKYAIRFIPAKR